MGNCCCWKKMCRKRKWKSNFFYDHNNIRKEIQLISNAEVLSTNEKIGNKLKNGDTVIYNNVFKGGKYFN